MLYEGFRVCALLGSIGSSFAELLVLLRQRGAIEITVF